MGEIYVGLEMSGMCRRRNTSIIVATVITEYAPS